MIFQESEIRDREDNFYKDIIRKYLEYGSVDEIFRVTNYDLPMSYPGVHHLISRWGIIKSVGPNSKLSEAITFLTLLTESKLPLESLYRKLPPSFKTSLSTMHRIAHNVKMGVTRRFGTALVITPRNQEKKILIGNDTTFGLDLTLPMTFSGKKEDATTSILRVLQQEIYSELAVEKQMPLDIIPRAPKSFMLLTIADIKVAVYHLEISNNYLNKFKFTSKKVINHKFESIETVLSNNQRIRAGVRDIVKGYEKYIRQPIFSDKVSEINLALSLVQIYNHK